MQRDFYKAEIFTFNIHFLLLMLICQFFLDIADNFLNFLRLHLLPLLTH